MDALITRLEELARTDPTVSPLATLRAEMMRASSTQTWHRTVPPLDVTKLARGWPLLHGSEVAVDPSQVRALLGRLAAVACAVVPDGGASIERLPDALDLLQSTITQDADRLERLAVQAHVDPPYLDTLGNLLALPFLHACGAEAASLLEGQTWEAGYCPVCAAWPALAEVRGIERHRWLRCGRCGTGWRHAHLVCAFCGNRDHRTQGYLAAEDTREARQAATCELCHGYLKTVASPLPLEPGDVFLQDMATLELDMAALDQGYARPETPGFAIEVKIVAG